jgi:hypothetical protein
MTLEQISQKLGLTALTPGLNSADRQVSAGFASDLLSDVLANGPRGGVLVTVQVHMNVIAVSVHAELSGVIFASGRRPDDSVIAKAVEAGVALFGSNLPAFELIGRLYALGVKGVV